MTQAIAPPKSLYESDFLLWTEETVARLKSRDFDRVDLENLIEEIECLGRSEKKEIKSRLRVLLAHLLKRMYVDLPECFDGWENTIATQRTDIEFALTDSPSLKAIWEEAFELAWRFALIDVRKEYSKKGFTFPDTWQFSRDIDAMLNVDFWEL
jgi:hypothetical protein